MLEIINLSLQEGKGKEEKDDKHDKTKGGKKEKEEKPAAKKGNYGNDLIAMNFVFLKVFFFFYY